jgi:hypothetical protein
MRLVNELMERMVLDTESPSRLRTVRAYFAKWSSEWPHDAALRNVVAAFDARLKRLGKKEPAAGSISNRARDIADELDLPGNALMLVSGLQPKSLTELNHPHMVAGPTQRSHRNCGALLFYGVI